ncbi:unnamed protein product [Mytilus edulis]|uniref:Uncharacterized protein n=1 Tax=Mytilus edulis TaxID=6550 RepID=A0A8S3V8E4_MYTED|nr:unnamed protein product [Mytilus edulis]
MIFLSRCFDPLPIAKSFAQPVLLAVLNCREFNAAIINTIEKSVSDIRNPAYDKEQSEKLSNIQDTLTKVEKICATVSTNTVEDQQKEKNQIYDKPSTNQSHEQITTRSKQRRDNFQVTETRDQDQSSSVVKDLRKNRIYRYKKTNITTLHDKTIRGASEFLLTGKLKANNIAFQVGSNDLEESTPEDVAKNMERLILDTQRLVPGSNIIINAILPRFYRNAHSSKTYESKRSKCNSMLSDLCNEYSLKFVKHENFVQFHFTDGIHLNQNDGIPLYVRNLKHVVNPLLGVINDQQNFENHQFPRQRNQQFRRENGNHFYKHPNPYDERPNRYDEENHQSATYMYDNSNNFYERETNHQNASHDKHNNYYQSYDDNLSNNGINMRLLKLALEGDFNSRTGDKLDYIKDDSLDINNFAQTNLLPDEYKIDNCFNRYSCDKVVNGQGVNLLDLSTSSSLRILNGRYIGDIMGNFTCMTSNGSSVVDYAIVSESLLSSVEYFKTHEFNYLSDHVKIEIFLKCMQREYNFDIFENSNWSSYKSFKWDSQKSKLKLLDHLSDETVLNNILNFEMQTFSNDQRGVDDETNKLTTILCNLAENSCVIKRKNFKKSKPKNKQPWKKLLSNLGSDKAG